MKTALRWLPLCAALGCGSVSVVRVPVEARLGERESPPPVQVTGLRVVVMREAVSNDPERRQNLTNEVAESYPTLSHQAMAVPQALREVGFDVVEVARLEDAAAYHAAYVLDLRDPHVQSFHPAQGSSVTLVGSAYDVEVRYSAALKDGGLQPLGVVEGHGHAQKRFLFMEPLAKAAFVGGLVSLATLGASVVALAVVLQFGLLANVAGKGGDLFGACAESVPEQRDAAGNVTQQGSGEGQLMRRMPAPLGAQRHGVCTNIVNNAIYLGFVSAVSLSTGLAGALAGALGENVFDVFLAAMHLSWVDPAWKTMVKDAHDEAARNLADMLAARAMADRARTAPVTPASAIPNPMELVAPPAVAPGQ
jgi:hypothetical protein